MISKVGAEGERRGVMIRPVLADFNSLQMEYRKGVSHGLECWVQKWPWVVPTATGRRLQGQFSPLKSKREQEFRSVFCTDWKAARLL